MVKRYDWPLGKGDGYLSVDEFEELFFALPAAEKEKLISLAFGDQALTLTELSDAELAAGMELAVVVNTDENTMMGIQIWPSQEALDTFEEKRVEWFRENFEPHLRDRIAYEGDVDFWFQQIKYFGADAIDVSGAGA